ncbi:MAG: SOS response-associated peptidase [Defluviitaleaceae bacterium]|nr:SOS response-associated peptidase [Defluviitaleaceae bacterium]
MCGRYSALTEEEIIEIREVIREVSLRIAKDDFENYTAPATEVYPTHDAPVIVGGGADSTVSFESLRWGFKKWDGKGVIINARSETLETKGMFKKHLIAGRCVVPAGEYYEWEQQGKQKVKHFIKDAEGNLLFMAGLYRDTADGREFVIITKDAYGEAEKIHDRMPVILRAGQIEDWLSGKLSPDTITKLAFNVTVTPCESDFTQMSL